MKSKSLKEELQVLLASSALMGAVALSPQLLASEDSTPESWQLAFSVKNPNPPSGGGEQTQCGSAGCGEQSENGGEGGDETAKEGSEEACGEGSCA